MMLEINDDTLRMEYATETVEVEEICDDQNPAKKFKKVVKDFDPKFGTDWKNDPSYKNWVEKKKDDDPTFQYETTESAECIEIDVNGQKRSVAESKTVRKPGTSNVPVVKNNRPVKRQIKVLDPNLPAFVCTEHNENISLDCRYCRIASGFKKKSTQKHVQNDEISSSGKVTVAIPKPNLTLLQQKNMSDGIFMEGSSTDSINGSCTSDQSTFLQKNTTQGKYVQKFRSEWLSLPEFKDWLIEAKISEDRDISCAKCKYCGTLLVNNSNNLVRHAISKKHMKNMENETEQTPHQGAATAGKVVKKEEKECKEDIFGRYIASELKRIKSKKTYEEVKWKILQALQSAAEKETDDAEPCIH